MQPEPGCVQRTKHWCFTCNNPKVPVLEFNERTVAYAVYQLEKGKSETPHFQGYFQSAKKQGVRLAGARKILKAAGYENAHLEPKLGTVTQCRNYCMKDEGRLAGPYEFGRLLITKQGERTDLHGLRDAVKAKRKISEIADDDDMLGVLAKHHRFEAKLRSAYECKESKEFRHVNVIVLWGSTGTGKTRKAVADGAFKWHSSSPEWWDGYQQDEVILIDEFYGQMKPSRLLQLLDGYSCRLPVKGGHTYANWTKVYITSNEPPSSWYADLPEKVREALQRRITSVEEMGPKPNRPFDFAYNRDHNGQ